MSRILFHRQLCAAVLAGSLASAAPCAEPAAPGGGPRPPASTLKTPSSPAATVHADGFLRRWLVHEPIEAGNQLTESAVETLLKAHPFPGVSQDSPWHAVDSLRYNLNLYHFAWALSRPTSNVLFWAVTIVEAPQEMRDVRLAIGSNAASVWWLNDERVVAIYNDRQTVIDDGVSRRVTLRKGRNEIRVAIVNGGGATDFCARFLDAHDRPIAGLLVRTP